MSDNLRTFYACQAVAIAPQIPNAQGAYTEPPASGYKYLHGVQSVGINSSFDFENIFELGQLEIYDAVLNIPEVEITIEKLFDGYKTVYGMISSGSGVLEASKHRACARFGIYKDTSNASNTNANAMGYIQCTGMYVSNVTYTFPVDGNPTESITLVGNHKSWVEGSGGGITIPNDINNNSASPDDTPSTSNSGILRRQNVTYTGPGSSKAQNVTISIDLAREDLFQFGSRLPYARIPTYPVEATAEIESLAVSGSFDSVAFSETTDRLPDRDRAISVQCGSFTVSLGSGCFLTSIAHGGGDATGGNATVTRSYTAYNVFNVTDSGTDQG